MLADVFETTLRTFLRTKPFQPFFVEIEEGETVLVDHPDAVAFNNLGAGIITPELVYMLSCEQVRTIRPATQIQEAPN